jgi:hypothetical protein
VTLKLNPTKVGYILCGAAATFYASLAFASTPSEMAGMSLQELLNQPLEEQTTGEGAGPWRVGIAYSRLKLDGYLDGTNKVSNSEVLFSGVPGTRTDKNFPVVPTEIRQEALILTIRYVLDNRFSFDLGIPYIRQSTDHISIVPGYDNFILNSEGLGDLSIGLGSVIKEWGTRQISATVGLSVPTGSINQKDDTPRSPGDQQLPYTMQLGSGTWDVSAGLNYQQQLGSWEAGSQLLGKLRTGENDRDYRLGNRASLSAWVKSHHHEWVRPSVKLGYHYWGNIHGEDSDLTVPGPFPYPAGITNPEFYGGKKLNASLGISIGGRKNQLKGNTLGIEFGKPIYQNLNGIQPKEVWRLNIHWGIEF